MLAADLSNSDAPPVSAVISVEDGECLALAGPSGAGKTTMLRMIAGLRRPQRGCVELGGRVLFSSELGVDLPPEQRRCGYVFQDYALFPHLPAWKNVAFGVQGRGRGARRERALELLDRFGIAALADARPTELSGGERQRVALARAVATEPGMLLLDEPLAALDVRSHARAARELAELVRELGIPAVLVTHDFLDASLLGSEIAVLDHGRIVQRGAAGALAAAPASSFVADFTGANVLHGVAGKRADGLTEVTLEGGASILSTDAASGSVAVSIQPWEITLRGTGGAADSARNSLSGAIASVTPAGNRLRVSLALPEPLVVEVTAAALEELELGIGDAATASFKASATRVFAR